MKQLPACLALSEDQAWIQRLKGFLDSIAALRPVDSVARLGTVLERMNPVVLLVDLRTPEAFKHLAEILKTWPDTAVLAFGMPATEPLLDAEQMGVYAAEDLEAGRQRVVSLVGRALDRQRLLQEMQILRAAASRAPALPESVPHPSAEHGAGWPPQRFPGALRHFDNVEALVQSLVEDVAGSLLVSRVGIFCRVRNGGSYRLRAGMRCLDDAREFEYTDGDPFVRWLALHAHVVARANLAYVKDPSAQLLLLRTLDQFGAEAIVPLQSREQLLGWLFVGHRSTGLPFDPTHIESLIRITECVSTTLENALLYEENSIQRTLAEALLQAMPAGIVAVDGEGLIRWFNDAARHMLNVTADQALGRVVETLDSRLADILRRALRDDKGEQTSAWTDPRAERSFVVRTRRLRNGSSCLGAMAVIQDVTLQRQLEEQQEQLERAAFWTDLAASMSHEIRNPLVAIKTFAQLLPERYSDPEFQNSFKDQVSREVDRLDGLIDQIDRFAHPLKLEFRAVDLRVCIRKSVEAALPLDPEQGLQLRTHIPDDLPPVWGDERALTDCFAHLLRNSVEALVQGDRKEITITAEAARSNERKREVEVTCKDNGRGIPADIADKVFSPFCTTKARGLGLGLPIVQRTVADHNGRVQIRSNEHGTRVTITLPTAGHGTADETHPDS